MTDAGICPFCQTALPENFCATAQPPGAGKRLSRAARLLAGATLVGASACSSTTDGRIVAPPYGAPPPFDAAITNPNVDGGAADSDGATDTVGAPSSDALEDRSGDGGPGPGGEG